MADICDLAQERQQQDIDRALALHKRPVRDTKWFCVDCGASIGIKRRRAVPGCIRCVSCQGDHESLQARGCR